MPYTFSGQCSRPQSPIGARLLTLPDMHVTNASAIVPFIHSCVGHEPRNERPRSRPNRHGTVPAARLRTNEPLARRRARHASARREARIRRTARGGRDQLQEASITLPKARTARTPTAWTGTAVCQDKVRAAEPWTNVTMVSCSVRACANSRAPPAPRDKPALRTRVHWR